MRYPFKQTVPFLIILVGCIVIIFSSFFSYKKNAQQQNLQLATEQKRNNELKQLLKNSNDVLIKTNELLKQQAALLPLTNTTASLPKSYAGKSFQNILVNEVVPLDNNKKIAFPQLKLYSGNNGLITLKVIVNKKPVKDLQVNLVEMDVVNHTILNANNLCKTAGGNYNFKIYLSNPTNTSAALSSSKNVLKPKLFKYSVLWLSGYYSGEFLAIQNSRGNIDILNNVISTCSANLNLEKAVLINNQYACVNIKSSAL